MRLWLAHRNPSVGVRCWSEVRCNVLVERFARGRHQPSWSDHARHHSNIWAPRNSKKGLLPGLISTDIFSCGQTSARIIRPETLCRNHGFVSAGSLFSEV